MSLNNIRIKKSLSVKLDVQVGSWRITEGIMLLTLRGKKRMQEMMTLPVMLENSFSSALILSF